MLDQKSIDHIESALQGGVSKEEIYKELIGQGYGIDDIQDAFDQLSSKEERKGARSRIIRIIVTIGAILIGLGFFSFIAANWQGMSKWLKISVIVISIISFYSAGWVLREKKNYRNTGEALILLGAILYGAGIFLVAQIFHTRGNWPDGFILWMIGSIFMGFAAESYPVFYLAVLVGVASIIGYPVEVFLRFGGYNPFLLTSTLLLLAATIITFLAGRFMKKRIPLEFKDYY